MAALQYVDVPGYHALLLRRTFTDLSLPDAIMDRARMWLEGTDAKKRGDKTWVFPSGASLTFGYLAHDKDVQQYQGAAFQFVGFDETTQFSEYQYRYLFSRLRRLKGSRVPVRMRAASNPGGPGHEWVKKRFMLEGLRRGRVFIPSRMWDNIHLDQDEYLEFLNELDPVLRAQLLNGDWEARHAGGYFDRSWFDVLERTPSDIIQWIRVWDLAATEAGKGRRGKKSDPDYTVGGLLGYRKSAAHPDGEFIIRDIVRARKTPLAIEQLVRNTAILDGRRVPVYIEQEPGAGSIHLIDHYKRNVLDGFDVNAYPARGSKIERASPASSAAEARRIKVVAGDYVPDFFSELEAFPQDGFHDDQVDFLSAGVDILQERLGLRKVHPKVAEMIRAYRGP